MALSYPTLIASMGRPAGTFAGEWKIPKATAGWRPFAGIWLGSVALCGRLLVDTTLRLAVGHRAAAKSDSIFPRRDSWTRTSCPTRYVQRRTVPSSAS
jgi:hypothetical protein